MTTLPDPSTPRDVDQVESGEALVKRVNLSPDLSATHASISSLASGLLVPIPTFPLLVIRIISVGATFVVPLRFANTISPRPYAVVSVSLNPISAAESSPEFVDSPNHIV